MSWIEALDFDFELFKVFIMFYAYLQMIQKDGDGRFEIVPMRGFFENRREIFWEEESRCIKEHIKFLIYD